jgi:hypothetical protein
VRTSSVIRSARPAWVIQVLAPVTFQFSPSRTARVRREPRSEPASGSVKTAVGMISPAVMAGRNRCFCSSVPWAMISSAAISERVPSDPVPIQPRGQRLGDNAHGHLAQA